MRHKIDSSVALTEAVMYDKHTHLYGVRAEKEPTSEVRCCRRRHSWGPICRAPAELSGANLKGVTLEGAALGGAYVRMEGVRARISRDMTAGV
jgi:hypothetical protein